MLSRLQKLLYNFSMFSPFFLLRYGWEYWNNRCLDVLSVIVVALNVLFLLWYILFFRKTIKKLPFDSMKVESFSPNDIKVFDFVLQSFPIIVSLTENNWGIFIYVTMVIYMTKSNLNFVSPILFFTRSNLYEVTIADGGGTCLLITKKSVANINEIKTAKHIFPYFYISG